jgi:hypothetical protein
VIELLGFAGAIAVALAGTMIALLFALVLLVDLFGGPRGREIGDQECPVCRHEYRPEDHA